MTSHSFCIVTSTTEVWLVAELFRRDFKDHITQIEKGFLDASCQALTKHSDVGAAFTFLYCKDALQTRP